MSSCDDGDRGDSQPEPSTASKLLWFVALWAMSVAALAIVGYLIKLVLKP